MSYRTSSPVLASRRNNPPHPSPSPRRRTKTKSRPIKTLKRCSSAPLLSRRDNGDVDGDGHYYRRSGGGTFFRPESFSDAFVSSPSSFSSPRIHPKQVSRLPATQLYYTVYRHSVDCYCEMIAFPNERI